MINHIYIHVPFCTKKCLYCNFYSVLYKKDIVDRYLIRLKEEIDFYLCNYDVVPETIYFGGGTPSLLSIDDFEQVIKKFNLSKIKELTVEINPSTDLHPFFLTNKNVGKILYFKQLKELGVNRLSLGVQSMNDNELEFLGRTHRTKDIYNLYDNGLGDIFDNISFDFIYGLPLKSSNHNEKSQQINRREQIENINTALRDFNPSHISIYCLSLEENVPLYNQKDNLPDDEQVSEMYFQISDLLLDNYYEQYELSSFCKEGNISHHNMCYWSSKWYLGLGPGASGYIENIRYQNHELDNYFGKNSVDRKIYLEQPDIEKEYIITGLRKTKGICIEDYDKKFNCSFWEKYDKIIKKLLKKGLIEVIEYVDGFDKPTLEKERIGKMTYLRINKESYFIANEVLCEFV
ncbi:MAG: radical SAM family heme chaperone HemW [Candidatus Cloacimonetes bacterium]|nr:radical SAM family heme chaperone HemW [Candidatus Cloacimonadota bacterium]